MDIYILAQNENKRINSGGYDGYISMSSYDIAEMEEAHTGKQPIKPELMLFSCWR